MKSSGGVLVLKRRDRFTITAQILSVAKPGITKTRIMYKANLSFAQLNEYLCSLKEAELLKVTANNGMTTYTTTQKGVRYLRNFTKLQACMHTTGTEKPTSTLPKFYISKQSHAFIVDN